MPWWLLGFSMVATTFSTDTPNFVTNLIRENGVWANWMWWAFVLTGMLTVFLYAKLWRRSKVFTDVEFYELRYSGKEAAFLRGFRAIYLGVIFNISVMAGVSLAAIKIGSTMFGWPDWQCVSIALAVTMVFSSLGGFQGVILTDFLLFILAMVGAFAAAYFAISHPQVGGLQGLFQHEAVRNQLSLVPDWSTHDQLNAVVGFFILPLVVQWWAAWYPGAEPGGGGYLAQRMLAAKNEDHAIGSVLFFQIAHYALRPWPWILVALASMVVFPSVADIQAAFPEADKVANDTAYSAMLTFLPPFWLGIVVTSLAAAYMSTISTHLNWGSSYLVHDFWKRFVNRNASDKEQVWVGRVATILLAVLTGVFALQLKHALQFFDILIKIGAGTGLLFILRWFWYRVNAWSEITAMVASFLLALVVSFAEPFKSWESWQTTLIVVGVTTPAWLIATLVTRPASKEHLRHFLAVTNPGGPGWRHVEDEAIADGQPIAYQHERLDISAGIVATFCGSALVYGILLGAGLLLYGNVGWGLTLLALATGAGLVIVRLWPRLMESRSTSQAIEQSRSQDPLR